MDDELTPLEEEQPKESRNSLRDSVRNLGQAGASYSRDAKDGLKDALPRGAEFVDGATGKDRGLKQQDFSEAWDKKGAGKKAEALTKAAANVPKKSAQATANNVKRIGTFAKNKKWFAAGGATIAFIIPIMMFFMWMMLFKNVHIKNLYVTYRWAQFNRGLSKNLKAQLEYAKSNPEAKIAGDAQTTASATDAPDEILKKANAAELGADVLDPEDATKIEAEAKKVTSLEQSVEGVSDKTLKEGGISRNVAAAEGTGDTPEAKAKSAQEEAAKNVDDEIADAGKGSKEAPSTLKDAADKVENADDPKAVALEEADNVINGSGRFAQAVRTIQGPLVFATFYCIFQDLYVTAKTQINKILIGGSMGTAQQLNKTADCQKNGDCDPNQIGAVANKFDNGEESFTETCGYARATQTSNPDCEEINPGFTVVSLYDKVGGAGGTALKMGDNILDPPEWGPIGAENACKVVMDSKFQVAMAALSVVAIGLSPPGAGGAGWTAAGKAVGSGIVQAAGTVGGKALIAHSILAYSGKLFADMTPHDMGNVTDMGNLAMASGSCANAWCPQVSDSQVAQLDQEYRTERIAANSKRSILEKFFDTESPDSVIGRVALNTPTTPAAVMGRMKNVFASITNPIKLNMSLGKSSLALAAPQSAYAADNGVSTYGLSGKVTAPPSLLSNAKYEDVVNWGKGRDLSSYENKYKKCAGGESDSYDAQVSSDDKTCFWDNLNSDGKMFFLYKYSQNTAYKAVVANNNQSNLSSSGSSPSSTQTASTPGPIFMIGDSITEGMITQGGVKDKFTAKSFQPVTNDASSGRSFTGAGDTTNAGTTTSAFNALALPNNIAAIKASKYVFVGLGTNPGGTTPSNYGTQIDQTIDRIKAINGSVQIYWMNVFSPIISSRTERNSILTQRAASKGFTVIDATPLESQIAFDVYKLHPKDGANYAILADYVVNKVTAGSVTASGDSKQLAQQLLDSPQVSFTTKDAEDALKTIASGGKASVSCKGGITTGISATLLSALLKTTSKYSIGLGYFTNGCHSANSKHYTGTAIDINQVNGQRVTGSEKISWDYLSELSNYLPDGSRYGQSGCGVNTSNVRLAHNITLMSDTCNHLHVDVP